MPNLNPTLAEEVIALTSPIKYHQIFTLSATQTRGPMRVTYSIAGPEPRGGDEDVPTVLFVGGMFGTRWMAVAINWLAEKEGVRVLFVDRPGFGGSTALPSSTTPSARIAIYLETIPLLLSHLRIPSITLLAAHSAGTIYAMNLLSSLPELFNSSQSTKRTIVPKLTLFAPWVHQSISSVASLQAAALLPNPLLDHWDTICGFMASGSGATALGASSGALSSVSSFLTFPSSFSHSLAKQKIRENEEEEQKCQDACGHGIVLKKALGEAVMRFVFAENTQGGNDEARLCLKSVSPPISCDWGACESYPLFISRLQDMFPATPVSEAEAEAQGGVRQKLKVSLVFAGTDAMIGTKGRTYLEKCWATEKVGQGIIVDVKVVEGTNHDSVVDPIFGAMGDMLRDAKRGE